MAGCIASVFWDVCLLCRLSHALLSGGQSVSPGCGSHRRAHVPAQTPVCRNEHIFLNTQADKNSMCFGLVFPSCFSARVFPPAEWDFVYALPRFPIPMGPGTVPLRCAQCCLSPGIVGPVPQGLYKAPQTQAPQTAHHSGKPWAPSPHSAGSPLLSPAG